MLCPLVGGCSWLERVTGNPKLESHELLERAALAEADGELVQAGQLLRRVMEANPEDEAAHRELARLLLKRGDVDGAVEQLRLAVRRGDDVESYVQLARIQLDHGKPNGAGREIEAALAIDPNHVESLLLKGELAERRGEDDEVLETYHRVLALDPENVTALRRAAEIQASAGRPERAAPLLRSICEGRRASDVERAEALWALGVVYGRQGRWRDAAEALAAAAATRPTMTADDWYRVAYARYSSGDLSGAWEDNRRALSLQPGHPAAAAMNESLRSMADDDARSNRRTAMGVLRPAGW